LDPVDDSAAVIADAALLSGMNKGRLRQQDRAHQRCRLSGEENIMARFNLPVAAAAALIISTTSVFALESNVTVRSSTPPDVVWKKIGDFCGIKSWIPAVSGCVISPDGKQRTVSLKGGGEVVERLDNWDDAKRTYTYSILSGPLPVSDYRSTLTVLSDGKGSALNWHSTYQAKGTSDAEAQKLIDGIYEDGAKSLLGG
jgi:hypothetical protein